MGSLRALILVADGVSAFELIPPIDILRRANIFVTVAGVDGPKTVFSDTGLSFKPDLALDQAICKGPFDVIVLPGGEDAAEIFSRSQDLAALIANQMAEKKVVAALGAGCLALMRLKVGKGKKIATSPHFSQQMKSLNADKEWNLKESDSVITDGCLITSQGSLFAVDFSFDLLQKLMGKKIADEIAELIIHKRHQKRKFLK